MIRQVSIQTRGQGMLEITAQVQRIVEECGIPEGLCTVFIRHTSASLVIQENADPSARRDLEAWFNRLVPDGDSHFTHTLEGDDDMPSHIKAALTATSISIPVIDGRLGLGTWQGIYLWEHRRAGSRREILIHISG